MPPCAKRASEKLTPRHPSRKDRSERLYIAPETILSKAGADGRTDLYSLGGVAYFLLTGTPVFQATTLSATLGAHVRETPEAPSVRLGRPLPRDLESIVLACLAKNPADRPRDARSLSERLRACVDASTWSESDATLWWAGADTAPKPVRGADYVSWSARTIAVDLDRPAWPARRHSRAGVGRSRRSSDRSAKGTILLRVSGPILSRMPMKQWLVRAARLVGALALSQAFAALLVRSQRQRVVRGQRHASA